VNGRSAYYYDLVWENPETGGERITEYEFHLREVRVWRCVLDKLGLIDSRQTVSNSVT